MRAAVRRGHRSLSRGSSAAAPARTVIRRRRFGVAPRRGRGLGPAGVAVLPQGLFGGVPAWVGTPSSPARVIGVKSVRAWAPGPAGVVIRVPGPLDLMPRLPGVVPGRIRVYAPRGTDDPGIADVSRYLRRESIIPVLSLAPRCPRVRSASFAAIPAAADDGRQRGSSEEEQCSADRDLADGQVAGLGRFRCSRRGRNVGGRLRRHRGQRTRRHPWTGRVGPQLGDRAG